jgi:hypothetical protein
MTQYKFSTLGITQPQLTISLPILTNNATLGFATDPNDIDAFTYFGTNDNPNALLPNAQDIINTFNQYTIDLQAQEEIKMATPLEIRSKITTDCKSMSFITCSDNHSCVNILAGSNSIATNIDVNNIENLTPVSDTAFVSSISALPLYSYNIINQDQSNLRIGPKPADWNNVFNFQSKDPTLSNIELMDTIGVLLSVVQNLNRRITQLENP